MLETFLTLKTIPTSFDAIGNMPDEYSIYLDPTVPPVQHVKHKVPIHYKAKYEKKKHSRKWKTFKK